MLQLERITVPDDAPMREIAVAQLDRARALANITSAEGYEAAAKELIRVRSGKRSVMDAFAPAADAADKAHKEITKLRASIVATFDQANSILAPAISAWEVEQERQRRLEQMRQQEEEQKKLEAQRLQEAELADALGDTEAAVQILDAPIVAPVIEIPRPKVAGMSSRSVWKFSVIDASKVDPKYLTPDLAKIQAVVNGLKADAAGTIGGIKVWEEKVLSTRRG